MADGVYVNGHGPYRFLVDTGTNVNLIEPGLAASIGLKPTFNVDLASAAGATPTSGIEGVEIILDSFRSSGQTMLLSPMEDLRQMFPDVKGVLGQAFLARFDYLLDLRGRRLEFGKHDMKGIKTRFRWINGRPAVSTNLGWLVLDSGAARVVLFAVKIDRPTLSYRSVSGSREAGTAANQTLLIENRVVWRGDAVSLSQKQIAEGDAAGLLPLVLFKSVYISNSHGYVVLD